MVALPREARLIIVVAPHRKRSERRELEECGGQRSHCRVALDAEIFEAVESRDSLGQGVELVVCYVQDSELAQVQDRLRDEAEVVAPQRQYLEGRERVPAEPQSEPTRASLADVLAHEVDALELRAAAQVQDSHRRTRDRSSRAQTPHFTAFPLEEDEDLEDRLDLLSGLRA